MSIGSDWFADSLSFVCIRRCWNETRVRMMSVLLLDAPLRAVSPEPQVTFGSASYISSREPSRRELTGTRADFPDPLAAMATQRPRLPGGVAADANYITMTTKPPA